MLCSACYVVLWSFEDMGVQSVELTTHWWEFRVILLSLHRKCWSLSTSLHIVCTIVEIFKVPVYDMEGSCLIVDCLGFRQFMY